MRSEEIKRLMYEAIEEPRPAPIEERCRKIWNQPFFYKIDQAKALTISYNPTDKGARTNYPDLLNKYIREGGLPTEIIFDTLYNFIPEPHFRKNYNCIFGELGINPAEIAHMDFSSYPYNDLADFQALKYLDRSSRYMLECVDLLSDQLQFVLIDGKKNQGILQYFINDYNLVHHTKLPINNSQRLYDLLIFKHNERNTILIYYGSFLWGESRPNKNCIVQLAAHIKSQVAELRS